VKDSGIKPLYPAEAGMELTRRVSEKGDVVFAINHNKHVSRVDFGEEQLTNLMNGEVLTGKVQLAAGDVLVCGKKCK